MFNKLNQALKSLTPKEQAFLRFIQAALVSAFVAMLVIICTALQAGSVLTLSLVVSGLMAALNVLVETSVTYFRARGNTEAVIASQALEATIEKKEMPKDITIVQSVEKAHVQGAQENG